MTSLTLKLQLPDLNDGSRFEPIEMALECLTRVNEWHFQRGNVAPLLTSGVRYREENPGKEEWLDAPTVLSLGYGDCEDLAAYYCAELRSQGIPAECVIKQKFYTAEMIRRSGYPIVSPKGMYLVHCMVRTSDGRVIDPSKLLGMKGEYR